MQPPGYGRDLKEISALFWGPAREDNTDGPKKNDADIRPWLSMRRLLRRYANGWKCRSPSKKPSKKLLSCIGESKNKIETSNVWPRLQQWWSYPYLRANSFSRNRNITQNRFWGGNLLQDPECMQFIRFYITGKTLSLIYLASYCTMI